MDAVVTTTFVLAAILLVGIAIYLLLFHYAKHAAFSFLVRVREYEEKNKNQPDTDTLNTFWYSSVLQSFRGEYYNPVSEPSNETPEEKEFREYEEYMKQRRDKK